MLFRSAKKYYVHVHLPIIPNPLLGWIWKSCCTMKIKMFAWMLIMDRLNTQDMLERRHWKVSESNLCILCHARIKEDRYHLFFTCLFSHRVWNYLQISWQVTLCGPLHWQPEGSFIILSSLKLFLRPVGIFGQFRSEENTSELQSLSEIAYYLF